MLMPNIEQYFNASESSLAQAILWQGVRNTQGVLVRIKSSVENSPEYRECITQLENEGFIFQCGQSVVNPIPSLNTRLYMLTENGEKALH